jgi:hypothetical protein
VTPSRASSSIEYVPGSVLARNQFIDSISCRSDSPRV